MKNEMLYNKTVDILVKAYFDDTLKHGWCSCCAVGNLVAAANNWEIEIDSHYFGNGIYAFWQDVFYTGVKEQFIIYENYFGHAKNQIDSTGYSVNELAKIEYAFEASDKGECAEDYMFNGLMAVIEVLDQIHENTDTNITKTSKQKFQKQLA